MKDFELRYVGSHVEVYTGSGVFLFSADTVREAMEELDAVKADKSEGVAVTIPATGWSQDSGAYPYYYDIAADGVTAKDRADLALAPASIAAAIACGICPATGVIRVRAAKVPAAEMSGEYWICIGKE